MEVTHKNWGVKLRAYTGNKSIVLWQLCRNKQTAFESRKKEQGKMWKSNKLSPGCTSSKVAALFLEATFKNQGALTCTSKPVTASMISFPSMTSIRTHMQWGLQLSEMLLKFCNKK